MPVKGDNEDRDNKIKDFLRAMGFFPKTNVYGQAMSRDNEFVPDTFEELGVDSSEFEIFWQNYLNGGNMPDVVDPSLAIADASKLAGVYHQAALGAGMEGLFGKGGQNHLAPLQPGVPAPTRSPGLTGPSSIFK